MFDDGTTRLVGVPFGSKARVILLDWMTEVRKTGSRSIFMGASLNDYCERLGSKNGGAGAADNIADQILRLSRCLVTMQVGPDASASFSNKRLVEAAQFADDKQQRRRRYVQQVMLSQEFYDLLNQFPVEFDRAAVHRLGNASQAIDTYLWLCFRLREMETDCHISWHALKRQFGATVGSLSNFKIQFEESLTVVRSVYPTARIQVLPEGLTLARSPPPLIRDSLPQ
jgi:hypothetical protein